MAGHILRLPEERPAKTDMTWTPSEGGEEEDDQRRRGGEHSARI